MGLVLDHLRTKLLLQICVMTYVHCLSVVFILFKALKGVQVIVCGLLVGILCIRLHKSFAIGHAFTAMCTLTCSIYICVPAVNESIFVDS